MATGIIILCVSNDLKTDQRMQRVIGTLSGAGYQVLTLGFGRRTEKFSLKGGSIEIQGTWFKKGKGFYLEIIIRLFFRLMFKKFDVVCSCDADTLIPSVLTAKIRGKRVAFDAHEYFSETSGVFGRPWIKKIWKTIEKTFVPRVNVAYTVSPGLAKIMESDFGIKFQLVRNLPIANSPSILSSDFKKDSFWIYQGALNKGRGLENLILASGISSKSMVIAGEGPLKEELMILARNQKSPSKILFLGRVEPEKLKGITPLAYGGINLVDGDGLSYKYSLANKFFDYMAAGIPQINSDLPEYRSICQQYNCSLFVENNSVEAIQQAIQNLEQDREGYLNAKSEALKAAKDLCWEKEEAKLLSIYSSLFHPA